MILKLGAILLVLVILIISISKWSLHPFVALILSAIILGILLGLEIPTLVEVLQEGFSSTLKWIAIIIIFGSFIGEVFQETGATHRISNNLLNLVGKKNLPWALGLTGYVVSISVFIDIAYVLFHPVIESLSKRSRTPVITLGLSLVAGLTVSHTLIPPTPGPIAVASILNANFGRLILINSFVGIFSVLGGVFWAKYFCSKFKLVTENFVNSFEEKKTNLETEYRPKIPLFIDLMPILTPIILMSVGTIYDSNQGKVGKFFDLVSEPMIAVLIGALIAFLQFFLIKKRSNISKLIESAIVKSALVIMITGAGGALGHVINASGIQNSFSEIFTEISHFGLIIPFLIAALLTSATGSITISLISSASIIGPMIPYLPYSSEIIAALIGTGALCVFHANASFFWLLNRLHSIPVSILYKTYTVQSLIMGLSGLFGVFLLLLIGIR